MCSTPELKAIEKRTVTGIEYPLGLKIKKSFKYLLKSQTFHNVVYFAILLYIKWQGYIIGNYALSLIRYGWKNSQ